MGEEGLPSDRMVFREVGIKNTVAAWLLVADALEEVAELRWLECEVSTAEREYTVQWQLARQIRDAVAGALEGAYK